MINKTTRLWSEIIAALLILYIPIMYAQQPSGQSAAGAGTRTWNLRDAYTLLQINGDSKAQIEFRRHNSKFREPSSSAAQKVCDDLAQLSPHATSEERKIFYDRGLKTLAFAASRETLAAFAAYAKKDNRSKASLSRYDYTTVFQYATDNKCVHLVRWLPLTWPTGNTTSATLESAVQDAEKKAFDDAYCTTLAWAAQQGNIAPLAVYVQKGGDPNKPPCPHNPNTFLRYAVDNKHSHLVSWLLDNGAVAKPALLERAVEEDDPETVGVLLQHGIKIPPSLLHEVAFADATNDNVRIMHQLLVHGANPNERGYDARTPLHQVITSLTQICKFDGTIGRPQYMVILYEPINSAQAYNVIRKTHMLLRWGADTTNHEESCALTQYTLQIHADQADFRRHSETHGYVPEKLEKMALDYFPNQMRALKEIRALASLHAQKKVFIPEEYFKSLLNNKSAWIIIEYIEEELTGTKTKPFFRQPTLVYIYPDKHPHNEITTIEQLSAYKKLHPELKAYLDEALI